MAFIDVSDGLTITCVLVWINIRISLNMNVLFVFEMLRTHIFICAYVSGKFLFSNTNVSVVISLLFMLWEWSSRFTVSVSICIYWLLSSLLAVLLSCYMHSPSYQLLHLTSIPTVTCKFKACCQPYISGWFKIYCWIIQVEWLCEIWDFEESSECEHTAF